MHNICNQYQAEYYYINRITNRGRAIYVCVKYF